MSSSLVARSGRGRLLLLDGHAYAYRSFYAIREMRGPSGQATNAIFGFVKTLAKLRTQLEPSHLAVVWDGGLDAERMAVLPEYKAQRPEMPADLGKQIDELQSWLPAAGLATMCESGVEADDLIATLARGAEREGLDVVIASSDKDFMQLVGPRIGLVNPNDKTEAVWGREQVRAKTGVEPEQIVDYLSLLGDAVDNIPGVPGVGVKTAAKLLNEFGSVEKLFERLGEVQPERIRSALRGAAEAVRRNQQMVRLKDALPGAPVMKALAPARADHARLREQYARWGFRSLLAEAEAALAKQDELL